MAAADRSDWPLLAAALGGLAVLSGLLLLTWARLLPRKRTPTGAAVRSIPAITRPPRVHWPAGAT